VSSGKPCIVWLMAAMTAMAACGKKKVPIDQQGRTVGARCILGHGMGQGQQARHALLLKRRDIKGRSELPAVYGIFGVLSGRVSILRLGAIRHARVQRQAATEEGSA